MKIVQQICKLKNHIVFTIDRLGSYLSQAHISANMITALGVLFALLGLNFASLGNFQLTLLCFIINRLCDILDGAIARCTHQSRFGAFFDMCADLISYALFVWGFILYAPSSFAAGGSFLLLSFFANVVTLLSYAIISKQKFLDLHSSLKPLYSINVFNYTDMFFAVFLICLIPHWFIPISIFFGLLLNAKSLLLISRAYFVLDIEQKGKN